MMSRLFLFNIIIIQILFFGKTFGQTKDLPYEKPLEPEVKQAVEEWQQLKFGLFMHWGPYSQWGIIESWSIAPIDRPYATVRPKGKNYFEYVKEYEALGATFNPQSFYPDKWAKAAKEAGMKYVIFTTKHHDGFNMFDTKQTDYKITSESCAFHKNPKANISKEVFHSFRKEGFMTGAYFSIADWHNNDYWWDYFPPLGTGINYSATKYPEKWQRLNDFIYNQLDELTDGDYGKLDILWFDMPGISQECKPDWERFAAITRKNQPEIILVAREQKGQFENYKTPEQVIPEKALDYPWETCLTMGTSWSYKPNDDYKSVHELVQLLIDIVSKGGNLLLNIGPRSDGEFDTVVYERLKGIGEWLKINGEGIYGSKPIKPYAETKMVFTQKGGNVYAFYLPKEEEKEMPAKIMIYSMQPVKDSQVFLLGYKTPLKWTNNGSGFVVDIPKALQKKPVCQNAWTFRFQINKTL